jgi:hypothetical protein
MPAERLRLARAFVAGERVRAFVDLSAAEQQALMAALGPTWDKRRIVEWRAAHAHQLLDLLRAGEQQSRYTPHSFFFVPMWFSDPCLSSPASAQQTAVLLRHMEGPDGRLRHWRDLFPTQQDALLAELNSTAAADSEPLWTKRRVQTWRSAQGRPVDTSSPPATRPADSDDDPMSADGSQSASSPTSSPVDDDVPTPARSVPPPAQAMQPAVPVSRLRTAPVPLDARTLHSPPHALISPIKRLLSRDAPLASASLAAAAVAAAASSALSQETRSELEDLAVILEYRQQLSSALDSAQDAERQYEELRLRLESLPHDDLVDCSGPPEAQARAYADLLSSVERLPPLLRPPPPPAAFLRSRSRTTPLVPLSSVTHDTGLALSDSPQLGQPLRQQRSSSQVLPPPPMPPVSLLSSGLAPRQPLTLTTPTSAPMQVTPAAVAALTPVAALPPALLAAADLHRMAESPLAASTPLRAGMRSGGGSGGGAGSRPQLQTGRTGSSAAGAARRASAADSLLLLLAASAADADAPPPPPRNRLPAAFSPSMALPPVQPLSLHSHAAPVPPLPPFMLAVRAASPRTAAPPAPPPAAATEAAEAAAALSSLAAGRVSPQSPGSQRRATLADVATAAAAVEGPSASPPSPPSSPDEPDVAEQQVCGHLNRFGQPCQRIGRCPFHAGRSRIAIASPAPASFAYAPSALRSNPATPRSVGGTPKRPLDTLAASTPSAKRLSAAAEPPPPSPGSVLRSQAFAAAIDDAVAAAGPAARSSRTPVRSGAESGAEWRVESAGPPPLTELLPVATLGLMPRRTPADFSANTPIRDAPGTAPAVMVICDGDGARLGSGDLSEDETRSVLGRRLRAVLRSGYRVAVAPLEGGGVDLPPPAHYTNPYRSVLAGKRPRSPGAAPRKLTRGTALPAPDGGDDDAAVAVAAAGATAAGSAPVPRLSGVPVAESLLAVVGLQADTQPALTARVERIVGRRDRSAALRAAQVLAVLQPETVDRS